MKKQELKAIFVEAWHGGWSDQWAFGNWTNERIHTVNIAKATDQFISWVMEFKKVRVFMIGVDEKLTLPQKIAKINQICRLNGFNHKNAILVSIHVNSGGAGKASGVEGRAYTGSTDSTKLATMIAEEQAWLLKISKRATKWDQSNRHGRLWIIRDTLPLAVLIECWFIDNKTDADLLKNKETEALFWRGIVRGIKKFVWIPLT